MLLSTDSVGALFKERASFDQSYDEGRFGRFGRHVLGFELALDKPFGIGPLQFGKIFPEDTHNSFLNAFMSGGWLSGVCYPALSFTTVLMGFRYLFVRAPWQRAYIAFFAAFLGSFGRELHHRTDHWRHYFLLLGTMWGLFAATQTYLRQRETAGRGYRLVIPAATFGVEPSRSAEQRLNLMRQRPTDLPRCQNRPPAIADFRCVTATMVARAGDGGLSRFHPQLAGAEIDLLVTLAIFSGVGLLSSLLLLILDHQLNGQLPTL